MGTFHDTKDLLHGITVVARMGDTVHVGRCHERDDKTIVLLDADSHLQDESGKGHDGRTNQEYLERVARFGVWINHPRLALPAAEVESLIPLNQFYCRPGEKPSQLEPVALAVAEIKTATKPLAVATGEEQAPVSLTKTACEEVRRLLATEEVSGQGLRLGVSGGGCSGFAYKVEFDEPTEEDLVVPFDGFDVLMDRKSTIYLRGVTLDHQQGLSGRGFQFQNPNASNTCGCGESFSL